jgi:para-nitrobenzyl esterase
MWVLLPSLLGAGLAVAPPDPSIAVKLDGLGTVHGVRTGDKHLSFMGIPYAEPPVGDNRWQPPVPKQPWDGILRAFSPGKACAQGDWKGGQVDSRDNYLSDPEDCLFLNVYVPLTSTPPPGGYPVMVYVHGMSISQCAAVHRRRPTEVFCAHAGGGYEGGSGGGFKPLSWYEDGIDDLIFVSMNYRMGIWGFLGSEELQASSRDGSTGNYGQRERAAAFEPLLLPTPVAKALARCQPRYHANAPEDQREAFKWVQTHIAQFGKCACNDTGSLLLHKL